MAVETLLNQMRFDPSLMRQVAVWEHRPARAARHAAAPDALDPRLCQMLRDKQMFPLYIHQAEAVEAALNGQHVVMVTGTASGKSLAYHLPTLHFMLHDPRACALYLFPTKALAQDQQAALRNLLSALPDGEAIRLNTYDGDTPANQRSRIRKEAGIILSNPDMLHAGILPYHSRWSAFFQNLRVVVIDEMHVYRGIFGSHMANVLRRLRRICRFYGSNPIYICASATIANPAELAEKLLEARTTLIDNDGAPRGEQHIILYNPPVIDTHSGLRRSYLLEARSLAARCLEADLQTIIFARARLTTEVLLGYIRDEVRSRGIDPGAIRGYRGGYLPLERRAIEKALREGAVRGVVATNALELGVDIGAMEAAILAGYPGTIASTWQQLGRAGRRASVSLGILIASGAPLDQYLASHPRYLFERAPEQALINPDNLLIVANHLRCAAYELPFEDDESFGAFDGTSEMLALLAENGDLHHSGRVYRWITDAYPAAEIALRSAGADTIIIQDHSKEMPEVIGRIDRPSAPLLVYEGAIYLHEGRQYRIEALDWQHGVAQAVETEADYYTDAGTSSDISVQEVYQSHAEGSCVKATGRVLVTQQVSSYRIVKRYTHETLGYGTIDLPPQQFETTAYWASLTPDLTTKLERQNILLEPNDYGPNWQQQRARARARDGYRCTRCAAPEREGQHDVHHLVPFREFGYRAGVNTAYLEANRLENLRTLCRACHRAVESARGTRSALSGAGSLLRNVATLHLMCAPNDIGIVVEQRSAQAHAPTITIYDSTPGGLGLASRCYDLHHTLLAGALEMVRGCPCSDGCPACIGPTGEDGAQTKLYTIALLEAMCAPEQAG